MEYLELVDKITPKENKWKNMIIAFISGGFVGMISELISSNLNNMCMIILWIIISSIMTGFGVFDKLVDKFKMGIIIPITGFAHSVTSASLDYKNDGLVQGVGSNCFKLAGSVIMYGIISSAILAVLKGVSWFL